MTAWLTDVLSISGFWAALWGQFLDVPNNGRENYYGTTFLYVVGERIRPWVSTLAGRAGLYVSKQTLAEQSRGMSAGLAMHRLVSDDEANLELRTHFCVG